MVLSLRDESKELDPTMAIWDKFINRFSESMKKLTNELVESLKQVYKKSEPKDNRRVLICGANQEDDCLCVVVESMASSELYEHDDPITNYEEEEVNSCTRYVNQTGDEDDGNTDPVVTEVGDLNIVQTEIGDFNSQIHQLFNKLDHPKVNFLPKYDSSSLKLVASKVKRVFIANKKMICIEGKVFDENPKRNEYTVAPNPEPPDICGLLIHGVISLPEVSDFFARLIQRVAHKSCQQDLGEVYVTQEFLEIFCGDQVHFRVRSFAVPENHLGQQSHGFRWPYGPVAIIIPFKFPFEIPVFQLIGALYMGNKPVLKVNSKVCIVMEQMFQLHHDCGLPMVDVDFIKSDETILNKLLLKGKPSMTLLTGSSTVVDIILVLVTQDNDSLRCAAESWSFPLKERVFVIKAKRIFLPVKFYLINTVRIISHYPSQALLVYKDIIHCDIMISTFRISLSKEGLLKSASGALAEFLEPTSLHLLNSLLNLTRLKQEHKFQILDWLFSDETYLNFILEDPSSNHTKSNSMDTIFSVSFNGIRGTRILLLGRLALFLNLLNFSPDLEDNVKLRISTKLRGIMDIIIDQDIYSCILILQIPVLYDSGQAQEFSYHPMLSSIAHALKTFMIVVSSTPAWRETKSFLIGNIFHPHFLCKEMVMELLCFMVRHAEELFYEDTKYWSALVSNVYLEGLAINWLSVRNGMDTSGMVSLLYLMEDEKLLLDRISFLAILYACSNSTLVDEGTRDFERMKCEYKLEPWPEYYVCLVDMLGCANHLDKAFQFVGRMEIEPTAAVWCVLLGACQIHFNKELGEFATKKLLELDSWNPIISAYNTNGQSMEVLSLFREMQMAGFFPSTYTFFTALQACEEPSIVRLVMEIHAAILRSTHYLDMHVANALVVMYTRCGKMGWLDCPASGQEIRCIIPSKVPLGEAFKDSFLPGKRYSSRQVIHQQRVLGRKATLMVPGNYQGNRTIKQNQVYGRAGKYQIKLPTVGVRTTGTVVVERVDKNGLHFYPP